MDKAIKRMIEVGVDRNVIIYDFNNRGLTPRLVDLFKRVSTENEWGNVDTIFVSCEAYLKCVQEHPELLLDQFVKVFPEKDLGVENPAQKYHDTLLGHPIKINGCDNKEIVIALTDSQNVILGAI